MQHITQFSRFYSFFCLSLFVGAAILSPSVLLASETVKGGGQININTASAAELSEALPGIGPAKSKAIVSHRERHGPFRTIDALVDVKGIGPATLEKIRSRLTLEQLGKATISNARTVTVLSKQEQRVRKAIKAALIVSDRTGSKTERVQKRNR